MRTWLVYVAVATTFVAVMGATVTTAPTAHAAPAAGR